MEKNKDIIKQEIEDFKNSNEGEYTDYYIGITNNIDRRLQENNESILEHLRNGRYTKGNPIYTAECVNNDEAVEIERFFQNKGMEKYNPRSFGNDDTKFIYCYKMTEENKEMILEFNTNYKSKIITSLEEYKKKH